MEMAKSSSITYHYGNYTEVLLLFPEKDNLGK